MPTAADFRSQAEDGDPAAMYGLGYCYQYGKGVPQDYAQAVAWYREAAEQGEANAMTSLGFCYENGKGVRQDYVQAIAWYHMAAPPGHAVAKVRAIHKVLLADLFFAVTLFIGAVVLNAYFKSYTSPAQWNGSAWSALGSGMSSTVRDLTVFNNHLVAGGLFTTAGGVSANYIAQWDGTAWSSLGSGMSLDVYALSVFNNQLVAGGPFSFADAVRVNCIARWNGTAWSALGAGVNNTVIALTVFNNQLVAGGFFMRASGVSANRIASWNGTAWSALDSGMNNWVNALAVFNNDLVAGGEFTTAGGVSANYIARWNGTAWSALGSGMNNWVWSLAVYKNDLVAGGDFTRAGGVPATNIARWSGTAWSALRSGMKDRVRALAIFNNDLLVGGSFTAAGGVPANNIARWSGTDWSALGSGLGNIVYALAIFDNQVVAGGNAFFTLPQDQYKAGAGITVISAIALPSFLVCTFFICQNDRSAAPERRAAKWREQERRAADGREQERRAAEWREQERRAAQLRENDRLATEKAEHERRAAEQRERDRLSAEKAERDRHAAEEKERERRAAEEKERQRLAAEVKERERQTAEQREAAKREQLAQRLQSVQPSKWLVEDLAAWLERVGLGDMVPVFQREKIDGESMAELTDQSLKDMGVSTYGERTKFLKQRDQLLATLTPATPTTTPATTLRPPKPTLAPTPSTDTTSSTTPDTASAVQPLRPIRREDVTIGMIIGQGSFGAVYKGTYRLSEVAVKVALPDLSPEQQAELRTEAETMQSIPGHPNVVHFLGACFDDRGAEIVCELCEAGPLHMYLKVNPSLSLATRVTLCAQVAAGMNHLEHQRIVHRDLATRNILLQPRGVDANGEVVVIAKVADFGLSRQLKDSAKDFYAVGRSVVAFAWAAPEVLLTRQHSSASDVWSFGVVVWEVFSPGQTPHASVPDLAAMQALMRQRQGALACPPLCPAEVWSVVAPCFEYEPSARPSFAQLHASFTQLLATKKTYTAF